MRVLYLSPYPPARDGIGTYTRVLAGAVAGRGHETAVVAARPDAASPPEVLGALGDEGLAETVARFKPDVVHLQFAVPAFGTRTPAVLRLLSTLDAPVVATLHEITRDLALLRAPGRLLYRRLAARCAALVVHTEEAARAAGPGTVLIPHFCAPPPPAEVTGDELRGRFGLDSGPLLLAFGFLHVDKGLDVLVDALRRLDGTVRLVVAGTVRRREGLFRLMELRDRIHERRVRTFIRRHDLEHRVVFTGYVPDGEIAAWFDAVDVVVLPYRKAAQSGVAHLALAMNASVVATTVGGLPELFERSTVPPGDPDALAEAIGEALTAPDGPPSAPPPGPAEVAARTEALYERVLAGAL